ncbi:MAG TPA: hemerythrin family protein [Bryobacteraceae bacterium]|nr:hemerythrin family protein [Bryobacteraceae bacterium]
MPGGAAVAAALEAEHDVLHEMWRDLRDSAGSGDSVVVLTGIDKFTTFCGEHFEHEEENLIKYRELARKKHIAGHQGLMDKLIALRTDIRENSNPNIAALLADWWVAFSNHILDCDRPALERLVSAVPDEPPDKRIWQPPARAEQ